MALHYARRAPLQNVAYDVPVDSGGSRKSSFYVWFLGAVESAGIRGESAVRSAAKYLLEREREIEPPKVTIQVGSKGIKIIETVPYPSGSSRPEKLDVIKHVIPDSAVAYVSLAPPPDDDVVCAILLIFNPFTRCPVHVHSYRCDSPETAGFLADELNALSERPENARRLRELESRLKLKGLIPSYLSSSSPMLKYQSSDGRSETSNSSEDSSTAKERVNSLYDALASELRERFHAAWFRACAPLLLPPRDYDTLHRRNGNLMKIDERRSQTVIVTGGLSSRQNEETRSRASSGRSSGIGSEESPPHQRCIEPRSPNGKKLKFYE